MRIRKPSVAGLALTLFVAFGAQSCFGGDAAETETMTPLLLAVHDAPVPFGGSDGHVHLVYELWMTNFSSGDVAVKKIEVLGDGVVLQTLDAEIDAFQVKSKTPGTEAFDEADEKGTPVPVTPVEPAQDVKDAMPLDQLIISLPDGK